MPLTRPGYRAQQAGFTLLELMMVVAILGVLASIGLPYYRSYAVRAEATEGVLLLSELRTRVESTFYSRNVVPDTIPGAPAPDGSIHGGPYWEYATLFGRDDYMWSRIEYQPKGPHRVIVLRAHRREEWLNSDIGLHLQVRNTGDGTLDFRCTVNETQSRMQFVPSTCLNGSVNDWLNW